MAQQLEDVLKTIVENALDTRLFDNADDLRQANIVPTIGFCYAVRLPDKPHACDLYVDNDWTTTLWVSDSDDGIWLFRSMNQVFPLLINQAALSEDDKHYIFESQERGVMWGVIRFSVGNPITHLVGPTWIMKGFSCPLRELLVRNGLASNPYGFVNPLGTVKRWENA